MRISLLLQREPFAQIVERTLQPHLSRLTGTEQTVRWSEKSESDSSQGQSLWVHYYLNCIVHRAVPKRALKVLINEFGTSLSPWKRPLQRVYMELAASPMFRKWFAHARVTLNPGFEHPGEWVIVGGGMKLRLLHLDSARCWSFRKDGFPARFLDREIRFRNQLSESGISSPQMLEWDQEQGFILEEYIEGTPLNRLMNADQEQAILHEVSKPLAEWSKARTQDAAMDQILPTLLGPIERRIDDPNILDSTTAEQARNLIKQLVKQIQDGPNRIAWTVGHGDFQPGNVLHGTKDWIIDWEHAGEQTLGYDPLVWLLHIRHTHGLTARLVRYLEHGLDAKSQAWLSFWSKPLAEASKSERSSTLAWVLLQDLSMRLDELDVPLIQRRNESFKAHLQALEYALQEAP